MVCYKEIPDPENPGESLKVILADNKAEAVQYGFELGIEKIRSIGKCTCGCGLTRYKVLSYIKPN